MSISLAILFVFVCCYLFWLLLTRKELIFSQLGVLGVFSLGYYPLPVLFKPLSSLAGTDDDKVFYALLVHFLFLISILFGAFSSLRVLATIKPLGLGWLDNLCYRHRFTLAVAAFFLYIAYVMTTPQTSYATENFEAYFEEKSPVRSILGAVSEICMGFICVSYAADSVKGARLRGPLIFGSMIALIVLLTLPLGQRTVTLAPIMLLFGAMASHKQSVKAIRILGIGVMVLFTISPFAVYLREARRSQSGEFLSASEVAGKYQLDANPLMQSFQSLIDRSDLVYNTVYMKDYIDRTEYVGFPYYYSVMVSPIPRLIYPTKPYVLSSNGQLDGEISILAWKEMIGGLGSLTAFGGLTAYREGGWAAVVLDGLADGAFFVFLARWLGGGGFVAKVFYSIFFLAFAVAKAPPCFFEGLAGFLGQAPLIGILLFISKLPMRGEPRIIVRSSPNVASLTISPEKPN